MRSVVLGWGVVLLTALAAAQTAPLPDVLTGSRYLKETDDVSIASVYQTGNGSTNVDVLTYYTANSLLTNTSSGNALPDITRTIATTQGLPNTNGNFPLPPAVSVAKGRMFNAKNDQFVALTPTVYWTFTYYNPASPNGLQQLSMPESANIPYGNTVAAQSTWLAMGDFRGDGLKEAFGVVSASSDRQNFTTGMAVLGAKPNGTNAPELDSIMVGPTLFVNTTPAEQASLISESQNAVVAGDFNGDGRDEVAILMNDSQTIRFYSVDPQTYAITPMTPATVVLPQSIARGALVAGRFTVSSRVDLVAVGNDLNGTPLFPYINTQPQAAGTFRPQVEQPASVPVQPTTNGGLFSFFAYAVPLIAPGTYPATGTSGTSFGPEQLVVAVQNGSGGDQLLWIGDLNLQPYAFTQLSTTDLGASCLLGMQVGNFDNQTSSGAYNAAPQLAFLRNPNSCTNLAGGMGLDLANINVPQTITPGPGQDWQQRVTGPVFTNSFSPSYSLLLNVSDVQGRSQRLGAPEIVTIPTQTQPEVVLGMPPMQADFVIPPDATECTPGTRDGTGACVVGLTYSPTTANSKIPAFANQFVSSTSSNQSNSNTATTSWGLSVKTSIGTSVSFNDLESNASASLTDTTQSLFNQKVSNQTINNSSSSSSVTAQTITDDLLFFTQRDLYVYYYPVLGAKDSNGNPVYVSFSVPGNLNYFSATPAGPYQWYQPVHEPGNVLSYPWSFAQLQAGFANGLDQKTGGNFGCQTIGGVETSFATSWQSGTSTSQSVGSTSSFSNDVSMSESAGAGVSGIDGASVSASLDIGTSTSLSSLNVETVGIDSGEGVKETSPGFPNLNDWNYYVAQYLWGQKPPAASTIWDQVTISNDQKTTGPLFVGFIADAAPAQGGGSPCAESSTPAAWVTTYNLPDVGVNHPSRWSWSTAASTVSFNYANGTTSPTSNTPQTQVNPITAPFYQMKGFFVTSPNATPTGPTLTTATAGQTVQLTARVYNFSLKDTDDPTLTQAAKTIHVDFYGQPVCSYNVCSGQLFEIGEAILGQPIPGYKSTRYPNQQNWVTANVQFNTSGHSGQSLVFWVVTWMEDASGGIVGEMPGHGLLQKPGQNLTNLLDPEQLNLQLYSNNVGLYGGNTPFFVAPATTTAPGATLGGMQAAAAAGVLQNVRLKGPSSALLDERITLNARVKATGGPVDHIRVTYWDGKAKDRQLISTQVIRHIDAEDFYLHGTTYQPRSCGVHDISVEVSNGKSQATSRNFALDVNVDPVALIDDMVERLRGMKLAANYKQPLLINLRLARGLFRQGETRRALLALKAFGRTADVTADIAGPTTRTRLAAMAGEATVIDGCQKDERGWRRRPERWENTWAESRNGLE